jgi:hypothetical protein
LYRGRAADVSETRPVFTGDTFRKQGSDPPEAMMLLQHPCALRIDGVNLAERLLVARVSVAPLIAAAGWTGNYKKMPLPDLGLVPEDRHATASFVDLDVVAPGDLLSEQRLSTLSQVGVNLLLQRWVHHNSRVVVPTGTFQLVTSGPFEEADLTEEWCDEVVNHGRSLTDAMSDAHGWIRAEGPQGTSRQILLEDPQHRSAIRKEMRQHLKNMHNP